MATKYKRRIGDRKEGRLLRSLDAFTKFTPFIMKTRNDSTNQFIDKVEVSDLDRWLRAKRAEGWKGLGMLHVFVAAYVRVVASRPAVNRFISGQRIYARNNIEVVMAVKRTLTTEGSETTIKIPLDASDTVFDVYRKMNEKIDEIKADDGEGNNTEQTAALLGKLPRIVLRFAIWLINLLDYFGLLPQFLLDASPFHGSMIITDLGSLGIPPVYHHIYNFGNLPVFVAFGAKRREMELDKTGAPVERKYMDYTVVSDERICDGYYFATAFKYFKYYLRNPELLETPPETVEEDVM